MTAAETNPLTDPVVPAALSRALVAAVRTGIIEVLGRGPGTAEAVGAELGLDPRGVLRLLNLLVPTGYVTTTGNRFSLSPVSEQTLCAAVPGTLARWVEFGAVHWQILDRLEAVLSGGRPIPSDELLASADQRLLHQRAMADTARPAAEWVAERVRIPHGATRMVDVGGSHGLYSAAICRRNPPLRSHVVELPEAVAAARRVAEEENTTDVVTHVPGDYETLEIGVGYDLAFFGNVVHHFSRASLQGVFAKTIRALSPGGTVAVWDVASSSDVADAASAAFALLFYLSSGTETYTSAEIAGWLSEAGFRDFREQRPFEGSTHVLHTARKP